MVVILSDAEAENVAQVLRRTAERIDDANAHSVAYVDDRGPNDFANQLEALVDAGDETVFVPFERYGDARGATTARYAFVTGNAAQTYAAKVNDADTFDDRAVPAVEDVTLSDPKDDIPEP